MNYYGTWRLQIWIIEIERRVNFAQNVFQNFLKNEKKQYSTELLISEDNYRTKMPILAVSAGY